MGWLAITLSYTEFITPKKDKFFKFKIHIENLLKPLVLLISCKKSVLNKRILKLVHIVPQPSQTNFSVCSVHNVNYLVRQFVMFNHVFGHCRYQHCCQIFLCSKVFCCIDQLIPQLHQLVKIRLSHCKNLDKSELFVVIFPEYFGFYNQVVGITFGRRKSSKSVLTFAKVQIVGTS